MTRYTSSDIEIHLSDITAGWMLDGSEDIEATNGAAGELVKQALRAAYPQYDVTVYTQQTQGHWFEAAGYPQDVDEEELRQIAEDAVPEDGAFVVLKTDAVADKAADKAEA
jgi:uncharacterized protein (AIM24 family)